MFRLMSFVCLTVLFGEVKPLSIEAVCVNELLSLIDNPTDSVCGEYAQCLVLLHKLLKGDLSMKDIEDIEDPYQEELVRSGVDCDLNFAAVIEKLRGPVTTTTLVATPTTTITTTTTTPVSTVTATSTATPVSTVTPTSTTTSSSTTTTTATPSTSRTTSTVETSTTPKYPSSTITSVAPTTTRTTTTTTTTTTVPPRTSRSPTTMSSQKSTTSSTTTTEPGIPDCIKDTDNGCVGRRDGDYPACFPVCQKGVYITCSSGRIVIRDCQFGWYTNPQRQRFLARIMFQPTTKRCEYRTAYCPRQLDKEV